MKTFKQKHFFGGQVLSIRFVALFMLNTNDFGLELTAKYRKTYDGRYGRNYQDILNANINNNDYDNLQLYYIGKEGGKYKNNSLIREFITLKNNTKESIMEKYLLEKELLQKQGIKV